MLISHNGWPVLSSTLGTWRLPAVSGSVRAGSVWVVFNWLAREYAQRVEPIRRSESWGYALRKVRGGAKYSNHASGTAVDFNAPAHPFGTRATQNMTATQIDACNKLVHDSGQVLKWLSGHDPMHWEIRPGVSPAQVDRFATELLQRALDVAVDGIKGPATLAALRHFQGRHGLEPDGLDGPATWAALTTSTTPTPQPTTLEERIMSELDNIVNAIEDRLATSPRVLDAIADRVWQQMVGESLGVGANAGTALGGLRNDTKRIRAALEAVDPR